MKYRRLFRFPFRRRARIEEDVDEELRFHLEMRTRELIARGLAPEEARAEALRQFGDVESAREYCREQDARGERRIRLMEGLGELWGDLRYGFRGLRRNPGFAATAILALALGIGAAVAIFSVVNAALLRPLPYPDADRLVRLWDSGPRFDGERVNVNPMNFLDWRRMNDVFDDLGGYYTPRVGVDRGAGAELVQGAAATVGLFGALGVQPIRGRLFTEDEYATDGPPVVLLSEPYWRGTGADPEVVGSTLEIDGVPHVVVGVLGPAARLPGVPEARQPRLWLPGRVGPQNGRGGHWLRSVGRLRAGVTIETAQEAMSVIAARLEREYPASNRGVEVRLQPLRDSVVGDARGALWALLGAVTALLLIACVNVADLQLVRATARRSEMGIRTALGAGRLRLARQLLMENIALAGVGGALGVALGAGGAALLRTTAAAGMLPRLDQATLDYRVLIFALALTLGCALVIGLAPLTQVIPERVQETLKEGGGRAPSRGRGTARLGAALAVVQIALAMVLLTGAGLLLRSFVRLTSVDPGFDVHDVVAMHVTLPESRYPDGSRRTAFIDELVRRTRALPGVVAAGAGDAPPFQFQQQSQVTFVPEDRPDIPRDQRPRAWEQYITPGYLEAMGMPIVDGRAPTDADRADADSVILVNEALARQVWPGRSAVGRRIRYNGSREVIGVVRSAHRSGLDQPPEPEMFIPYAQWPYDDAIFIMARARVAPATVISEFRSALHDLDPGVPLGQAASMDALIRDTTIRPRVQSMLFGVFAAIALALALLGVYGVLSYSVSRRTHEFGVRLALGAGAPDLLRSVLARGLALTAIGLGLGLAGALWATRALASLLYGITPTDPATFAATAALFVLIALLACWIPARRATRTDPLTALRTE